MTHDQLLFTWHKSWAKPKSAIELGDCFSYYNNGSFDHINVGLFWFIISLFFFYQVYFLTFWHAQRMIAYTVTLSVAVRSNFTTFFMTLVLHFGSVHLLCVSFYSYILWIHFKQHCFCYCCKKKRAPNLFVLRASHKISSEKSKF